VRDFLAAVFYTFNLGLQSMMREKKISGRSRIGTNFFEKIRFGVNTFVKRFKFFYFFTGNWKCGGWG
jgi:hypothetical protein